MEQRDIEVIRKIKSSIGKTVYYRDDYMGITQAIICGYCYLGGKIKIILELYSNPFKLLDYYKFFNMFYLQHHIKNKTYKIYKKCQTDFMAIIDKEQIKI